MFNRFIKGMVMLTVLSYHYNAFARQADSLAVRTSTFRSVHKITGQITDASSGKPLAGISVKYQNYSSTFTDDKGKFSISVPGYQVTLSVSGQGFQQKEVALKGRREVKVSLFEESFSSFYDAAVLPYGLKSQNKVPYAVASLSTNGAWASNAETPDSWLQGKVPGLNAIRRSGTPSAGANLFLRGLSSVNATNQPLIVVDGMIYDNQNYGISLISNHVNNPLQHIDIKDIDNITIVKDGLSSYGSKGANGVILITTARAKELATRIDFAAYAGVNFRPENIPLMTSGDYRLYLTDLLTSAGYTNSQIQSLPYFSSDANANNFYGYQHQTSWQNKVLENSFNQNYYLKITGGDNVAKYALSAGFQDNGGIISNTSTSKYFTRFNADFNLTRKLTAGANLSFTYNQQKLQSLGLDSIRNPLYLSLVKSPFLAVNEISSNNVESPNLADTDIFGVGNPVALIDNARQTDKNYRFGGIVTLNYALAKQLNLSTLIGITYDKIRENIFIPRNGVENEDLLNAEADSRLGSQVKRLFILNNDTRLSYSPLDTRLHKITFNTGFRFNQNSSETDYALGFNSATDDLISIGNGASSLRQLGGDLGKSRWLNTYLALDYELAGKYFLNANLSADASSRFGKNIPDALSLGRQKFAVLPSVGAAWLVSSEKFLASADFLELLKLRASYGITGNDDIGNYSARQYYTSQNLLGMEGLVRANIPNRALKWETVKKVNAGLDVAFFQERLSLSADVYSNRTTNLIFAQKQNDAVAFSTIITNDGSLKTNGYELNVNARLINRKLKWDLGFNVASYRTEMTGLGSGRIITDNAGASYVTEVGEAPNLFYGYRTEGVYSTTAEANTANLSTVDSKGNTVHFKAGDVKFTDTDKNGVINGNDRVVIGNPNPDFYGGILNTFNWKNWSLNALLSFSVGNDIYNNTRQVLESGSNFNNQTLALNNRWRAEGQITDIPAVTYGDPAGNSRFSDRWIEDGSYLRLRTLSLSYTVPAKLRLFRYATVYATGNNLFTLTKYLGYDPEFNTSGSVYGQGIDTATEPQFRSVQLGLRVGF